MKNHWIRPEGVTKEEMYNYASKVVKSEKKLDSTRFFKSLECRTCEQCKRITENKREYVITCNDGYSRICDIGQADPIECLKHE
jgi:hypothetical protein